uniref:(northern house mosquito) hypothetical protein n=1 Tax=Culex pipiens TaxID=7175 RepID=A0A8D8A482_CULPI
MDKKTLAKNARVFIFLFCVEKILTNTRKIGFKFVVGTDAKIGNSAALICFSSYFYSLTHIPSNMRESRSTRSHLTNTEAFLFRSLACHFFHSHAFLLPSTNTPTKKKKKRGGGGGD